MNDTRMFDIAINQEHPFFQEIKRIREKEERYRENGLPLPQSDYNIIEIVKQYHNGEMTEKMAQLKINGIKIRRR